MKEDCGAFVLTTNGFTTEIMAVTEVMVWLESKTFFQGHLLSDSVNMLMKVERRLARRQLLESMHQSRLTNINVIIVPWHVSGTLRDDRLARMAAVEIGPPVGRADILEAVRETGRKERCKYRL